MGELTAVEIKAFVPARDFELSKQFYQDLGFVLVWSDEQLAYFRCGECSFLLQHFYREEHASNFMMHLLTSDVEAWWQHVIASRLTERYGVLVEALGDRPWGLRDFAIVDPTGVLWRIGQNIAQSNE
jgi:catechol 2,3-dioxygenase-like lactoylglutathione lyase family enzyme